jgi:peptidoglycan hydrolase-like protein with peptidoglycan-binding domain
MAMTKRIWLCFMGAVLLLSAVPVVSAAQSRKAAHATVPKKTVKKKKTTASRSRRTPKPRAQMAPTRDRIREIQSALQQKGAYQGDPTGKWDDSTVEAMKTFQDKNGLDPTGEIDALTLEKLGLGSATAGEDAPVPMSSTANPASDSSPSSIP